jgi:hypothetical protein
MIRRKLICHASFHKKMYEWLIDWLIDFYIYYSFIYLSNHWFFPDMITVPSIDWVLLTYLLFLVWHERIRMMGIVKVRRVAWNRILFSLESKARLFVESRTCLPALLRFPPHRIIYEVFRSKEQGGYSKPLARSNCDVTSFRIDMGQTNQRMDGSTNQHSEL